ncbi:MAG: hypothetical protein ACLVBP_09905 [Ruminococcus sp.]
MEENTAFETMDRKAVRVMRDDWNEDRKKVEEEKVNVCKEAIQGIEERGRAAGRSEGIRLVQSMSSDFTKSPAKRQSYRRPEACP